MLDIELIPPADLARAPAVFHRDGFVAIADALTPEQLDFAREGARRVVDEQMAATPLQDANRGYARYSFGSQIHHPEWAQLIELPTVLPVLDAIWGSEHYICSGAGGDYSTPGARIQHLHDPLGQVSIYDMPVPFIVVNFLMVDFSEINGAIRFVPGTQRTRLRPPTLEDEPEHWKRSILCAPAGTAVVRDVRCWHGGTANDSQQNRIMTSVGYFAPWFRRPESAPLPLARYEELSARGREMCRHMADWQGHVS